MTRVGAFLIGFALLDVGAYLLVTAPTPLPAPDESLATDQTISVRLALTLLNAENAQARSLYTQEIVAPATLQNLHFSENWTQNETEAGPLPALLLRETGRRLEQERMHIGLYLGSDQAIRSSNQFAPAEASTLRAMRQDRQPRFFYDPDLQQQVAMFPDIAIGFSCIDCHNHHPDSPKHDWHIGDVMGATTFTYPSPTVSTREFLAMVSALRSAIRSTYESYTRKAASFANPPGIGSHWPREGRFLPDPDEFMRTLSARTSPSTLDTLLVQIQTPKPSRFQ